MASSDKPDFIEIAEKDAPVKLTSGGLFGDDLEASAAADTPQPQSCPSDMTQSGKPLPQAHQFSASQPGTSQEVTSDLVPKQGEIRQQNSSRTSQTPISSLKPKGQENDDVANLRRQMTPANSMSKLPGGTFWFVGLLMAVCFFGNQIDVMRNKTLADLAKSAGIDNRSYVETVGDLGNSLVRVHDFEGAEEAYRAARFTLATDGLDNGAKGAFIRLKLAQVDFAKANEQSALGYATNSATFREEKFDKSRKFEGDAEQHAKEALDILAKGDAGVNTELPFLLSDLGNQFENWSNYDLAVKLNEKALGYWPRDWRNGRAAVDGYLGWQHLRAGNSAKAEEHLKNSLNWTMKKGVSSTNAWRLSILGRSQVEQKKYMDAEVNLARSIEMLDELKKSERVNDVEYARIYTDQGRIKAALGNNNEAMKLFEKARAILKKQKNRTYDTMRNQLAMANLFRDNGQFSQAQDLYSKIIKKIDGGDEGPDRKTVMSDWELLRRMSGGR